MVPVIANSLAKRRKTEDCARRRKAAQDGARAQDGTRRPKMAQDGATHDGARRPKKSLNRKSAISFLAGQNFGGAHIPRPLFKNNAVEIGGAKAPFSH
jgi:hypothetical protein